ncbi:MAG TPA: hypothetical protein VKT78_06700 [Fimbriimonadaceae bacterium]|nr:hypothetical protein [Fimbriimonadaceae bacterium]
MILHTLLLLAGPPSPAGEVTKRFQAFIAAHPALSADCSLSGWHGAGKGEITVRHGSSPGTKADWQSTVGSEKYRFVTDGEMGIDILPNDATYDRLPTIARPYPGGRLTVPYGFPYPLVAGTTPFQASLTNTTYSKKGDVDQLVLTIHTSQGDTVITGDFGTDGRLLRYDAAKGATGKLKHEIVEFSNFKFGAQAIASNFNTNPPIGFSAFAFDMPPDILLGTSDVPAVKLHGAKSTTLAKLADQPRVLVAFVDDPIPDGLLKSLNRLEAKTPVVAVALDSAAVKVGKLPLYRTSEAGFDQAGIRATPQFYLLEKGKVIQAWSGYLKATAPKFEAEVLSYLAKG